MALNFTHFNFVIRQGGERDGIPVHQPFAAVDQSILEEAEERLADGGGAHFIHREAGAVPIAGAAHRLELFDDRGFVLVLPLLHGGDELFPAKGHPFLALLQEAFFHDGLGGDAGMIRPGHPQRVATAHPVIANQTILERVVQGVPQVQRGRDIRRGNDDAVRLGVAPRLGMEGV